MTLIFWVNTAKNNLVLIIVLPAIWRNKNKNILHKTNLDSLMNLQLVYVNIINRVMDADTTYNWPINIEMANNIYLLGDQ